MLYYSSTRGDKKKYMFSEAILKGIAADGGLLVPESTPHVTHEDLEKLQKASYQEIAFFVYTLFQVDFPEEVVRNIITKAYADNFDTKEITPVVHLKDNQYILELWHGPTSAFKDMALQIMPHFFSAAIHKNTPELHYLILVATSGDTGAAALNGYRDKENISIMVFYPNNRVSKLQELQMRSQEGKNISVMAMEGDFDAVQRSVKEVFSDNQFNQKLLKEQHVVLSSANSINWGRLMAQIIYYLYGYLQLVNRGTITLGETIDIAVPTGNFGNMLAAFYAKKMGLPIKTLLCASNENNVLTDFLRTGVYDISKRSLVKTVSPSMDILIASNIERLLFLLTGDAQKISGWMEDLKNRKKFSIDEETKKKLQEHFFAGSVTNTECLESIKQVFNETGYVMDPHTAVAQVAAEKFTHLKAAQIPLLICSTAHYAKFPESVYQALFGTKETSRSNVFKCLDAIQNHAPGSYIPQQITLLQKKSVLHNTICKPGKTAIEEQICGFLQQS